jgi:DNA end-binding protein Ku
MPQTIWKGAISFGLVTIPVKLYAATEERGVSLHQVHISDGGRIRYRRICEIDGDEVPYRDIARGYQLPDGDTIVLTEEDMANLPLASSRSVEVLQFVDSDNIDPINFGRSYYLEPDGPGGKPYVLLRDALRRTDKVAVVKVALRSRESLATLRPAGDVLVLQMMLWPDEVRDAHAFAPSDDVEVRAQEVANGRVVHRHAQRRVRSVDLHRRLPRGAAGGHRGQGRRPAGARGGRYAGSGEVVDLMDALRRSVEEAKRRRGEPAESKQPSPREVAGQEGAGGETSRAPRPRRRPPRSRRPERTAAKKSARKTEEGSGKGARYRHAQASKGRRRSA